MTLTSCRGSWGTVDIGADLSNLFEYQNAVYKVSGRPGELGLFDSEVYLISLSMNLARCRSDIRYAKTSVKTGESTLCYDRHRCSYLYCGNINHHYGHFIVYFLPRLWSLSNKEYSDAKIIINVVESISRLFEIPFIASILGLMDLTPDRFVQPEETIGFDCILVTQTSFAAQEYAYSVFGTFAGKVGQRALGRETFDKPNPIHLLTSKIISYAQRFGDESLLEHEMRIAGLTVVYPEQLSFREQLDLFAHPRTITSTVGSALHSQIFVAPRYRVIALNALENVNANYLIFDRVCGANVRYVFDDERTLRQDECGSTLTYLSNATRISQDLLRLARI